MQAVNRFQLGFIFFVSVFYLHFQSDFCCYIILTFVQFSVNLLPPHCDAFRITLSCGSSSLRVSPVSACPDYPDCCHLCFLTCVSFSLPLLKIEVLTQTPVWVTVDHCRVLLFGLPSCALGPFSGENCKRLSCFSSL